MKEGRFLSYDGRMVRSHEPVVRADNRSFRYGDGCFETMRCREGCIPLWDDHAERLFSAMERLKFQPAKTFTPAWLQEAVAAILHKNGHLPSARVRLMIFRGQGGLYDEIDHQPHLIIETWAIDQPGPDIQEKGLVTGVFPHAKKMADGFSHIKSNNYQCYVQGALWAREQGYTEAFILNGDNCLADATMANIFLVSNGVILTPALSEGCVAGVMRKLLLRHCKAQSLPVAEKKITLAELREASEIFLSSAISGIRWVGSCDGVHYRRGVGDMLYREAVLPLFQA